MKPVVRIGVAFFVLLTMGTASAQEPQQSYDSRIKTPPPIRRLEQGEQVLSRPCLGTGYVAYAYPAFGSCPCDTDRCFSPARYYCGGTSYHRQWFGKWIRAHFGKGSMLDEYPCECIYPTIGRLHLRASISAAERADEMSPIPAPAKLQELVPER